MGLLGILSACPLHKVNITSITGPDFNPSSICPPTDPGRVREVDSKRSKKAAANTGNASYDSSSHWCTQESRIGSAKGLVVILNVGGGGGGGGGGGVGAGGDHGAATTAAVMAAVTALMVVMALMTMLVVGRGRGWQRCRRRCGGATCKEVMCQRLTQPGHTK